MKHVHISLALVVVVTSAAAQTSAPGICFSFNTTGAPNATLPLVAGGDLHFGVTAPVSATIEQIDVSVSSFITPAMTVQVFQWTGTSIGALLGTGASLPPTNGVSAFILAPPVPVAAGSIYVLRLTIAYSWAYIGGDPAQPTPIPYLLNCAANPTVGLFPPCSVTAPTGTHGTWLKFRAMACGQTPFATATQIGTGCGGPPSWPSPILYTFTPPVLGTQFTFFVGGQFGASGTGTIHLFWAAGPATAGLNLGLGFGCTSYLDPVSVQPLVTFPATAITNTITLVIPLNSALAGVTATTQALVFASTGVPTPAGIIQISNALQLSLGY